MLSMRRIILSTTAFGIGAGVTQSLTGGLVAGVVSFMIIPAKAPTKVVMIHDFETGRTITQPMDAETQRYIQSRERKEQS